GPGQGQRYLALGHGRRLARPDCPGVRFGRHVGPEDLADVAYSGELAIAVADRRLAESQAATLRGDLHRQALAVVAGDHALARSGLVERRPARKVEAHRAVDVAGMRGGGRETGGQCKGKQQCGPGHGTSGWIQMAAIVPAGGAHSARTAAGSSAGASTWAMRPARAGGNVASASWAQVTWYGMYTPQPPSSSTGTMSERSELPTMAKCPGSSSNSDSTRA